MDEKPLNLVHGMHRQATPWSSKSHRVASRFGGPKHGARSSLCRGRWIHGIHGSVGEICREASSKKKHSPEDFLVN